MQKLDKNITQHWKTGSNLNLKERTEKRLVDQGFPTAEKTVLCIRRRVVIHSPMSSSKIIWLNKWKLAQ